MEPLAPIEVTFAGGFKESFAHPQEIEQFIAREAVFWANVRAKIDGASPFEPNFPQRYDQINYDLVRRWFAEASKMEGDAARNAWTSARDDLQAIAAKGYPASRSPSGQRIAQLASEWPEAAWVELWKLAEEGSHGTRYSMRNVLRAFDFMEAWDYTQRHRLDALAAVKEQAVALEKMRDDWKRALETLKAEDDRRIDLSRAHMRRTRKISMRWLRNYRDLQAAHQGDMDQMKKSFSTEMKLGAAEKFWGRKRRLNRQRQNTALKTLAGVGLLGMIALIGLFWGISAAFEAPTTLSLSHSLFYFVPTILYVWFLRIFATEYRTNKNMADDAEEREAMVFTFKALEYEQRVGDEERLLILNALFRPHGNTGEESVPTPVWEAVIGKLAK